jgi:pimeloyl-ACP methyl ester carboxylesterase
MRFFRGLLILIVLIAIAGAALVAIFRDPELPHSILAVKYGNGASQFVTLPSGANVHYRDQGNRNGPALVLLHGSNASLHTWEPWATQLASDFRIISVDLPSHGLTGAVPGDDYSQPGMVKFVKEFTAALKLERFALAGNSMGGGVAARLAIDYPGLLTHLILVDAGGMPTATQQDPGLGFRIARIPVLRNLMLYVTPRNLFEDGLKKAIDDDKLVTAEMVDRHWELNRREGNRAATLKRFQIERDNYIEQNATKIATPTLILWGETDTLTPRDMGDAYAAAIKGSRFIVYKNVGHIPMEEVPEQSARAVREFITPSPLPPPS